MLDVTEAIRAGATNLLAVRVLNPTHERIDGMVLNETPQQARVIPYSAGAAYNHGGITGSVELLAVPAGAGRGSVRAAPIPKTGVIRIQANVRNAGPDAARGRTGVHGRARRQLAKRCRLAWSSASFHRATHRSRRN